MSFFNDIITIIIIGGFFLMCIAFFTKQEPVALLRKVWDWIRPDSIKDKEEDDV